MAKISVDISSTENFIEENKTTQSLYPPTAQANLDEPWCHVQETMNLLIISKEVVTGDESPEIIYSKQEKSA